jgi:hypothetical protein
MSKWTVFVRRYREGRQSGRTSTQLLFGLTENSMLKGKTRTRAIAAVALLGTLAGSRKAVAQDAAVKYPRMAPIVRYLMSDDAEIALARSAAPDSIARGAEVRVLAADGYHTVVRGTNGFVCIVGRGWSAAADPDYWNPKVRVPMCVNAPAARSYLLRVTRITDLALKGQSLEQVNDSIAEALARKELPPMEAGAMCYMMSKDGYGGDVAPHWPSHLMFFYSDVDPAIWGANVPGSPIIAVADPLEHLTQFVITTQRWSDGTEDHSTTAHHAER